MEREYDGTHPAPGVKVYPVPRPKMPRTKKAKYVQEGGLRLHDVHRPQPAAAIRLPNMLVPTRGKKAGPTSGRMSKGKHKKSGSARSRHGANLCHTAGVHPDCGLQAEQRRGEKILRRLARAHAHLCGSRDPMPVRLRAYQRARQVFASRWPHLLAELIRKEHAHRQCFV